MHLILNENGTVKEAVPSHKNIEWDSTHFCRPDKLTEAEAAMFRVAPLADPMKPSCDPLTEEVVHTGYHQEADGWHWTFEVRALPAEVAAQNIQQASTSAIQAMLDEKAQALRWDNIKSARAGAGVPLTGDETPEEIAIQAQAVALATWDRKCWAVSLGIEQAVLAGARPRPTPDEVLAEMPEFVAP